jgi:hypothetical protein
MHEPRKLLITPVAGYTPHIGVLVATLQRCREKTIHAVKDLTIHQLDYLWDEHANTIGALLLHLAAIEAAFQEYSFTGRHLQDNPERNAKWEIPIHLGEPARQLIKRHPIEYYLHELQTMRAITLEQLRLHDDGWLWQEVPLLDAVANNYWMWYHVYEDEINHRGEINWLKSRIPAV